MVPLSQGNLVASARNIVATLRLAPEDRCLNIMPLFHIHGLMAPVLASLAAGAEVVCTPGFDALRFFAWLDEARPVLVQRGANHAPGDSGAGQAQRGRCARQPAALRPFPLPHPCRRR